MNKPHRQLTIDLPDLIDITRVLQSLTDAFIAHHQRELQSQQQAERQLALFELTDKQDNMIF